VFEVVREEAENPRFLIRQEAELTRHELTMVAVRERNDKTPAEAIERHLAEQEDEVR
jgi:hypothetical protein